MNVLLHRFDLRVKDNAALKNSGEESAPLYIFDPKWLENDLVSDARIKFVLESLKDLENQYKKLGTDLCVKEGATIKFLEKLSEEGHKIHFNKNSNHFRRNQEISLRKKFHGYNNMPIQTNGRDTNWNKYAERWFKKPLLEPPKQIEPNPLEDTTKISKIKEKYHLNPDQERFGQGGTEEARKRLAEFLNRISQYAGCVSSPSKAESSTSHLSPYIRYGCISPREIYMRAQKAKEDASNKRSVEMFKDRIFWNQHFHQKLEDNPELHEKAINPIYQDLHKKNRDEGKIKAWKNGKTGYPLVDASMRALVETGWLNFRMRAMCASFYSYGLKQWWKEGADFFYKHLIDADVAINYYQWQMQSGLIGVHANRIYNPTKQVRENDTEGRFIKKYVPELQNVPEEFIAEPWKMPERVQKEVGVIIGEDYPEPVINNEREARKAREFFKSKAGKAYASFKDDEVWRKASLSSRHDRQDILEKADDSQKDLSSFS